MRTHLVAALGIAVLLAGVGTARAQATCTAEGTVLDADNRPVPGVEVLLSYKGHIPQKYRTKTNKKGVFVYVNVWSGPYDITFSREGLGEVTMKDFVIRDVIPPDKPPVFHIGAKKPAAAPPAGEAGSSPTGPSPADAAAALAAELDAANRALAAGELDTAIAAYESVIAKAPLAEAHHNLGIAYRKKGDAAKAEAEFRKAGELKPGFAAPHGALSTLLASSGKKEDALAEAQEAAKDAPENPLYAYNLAVLLKDNGKNAEAKDAFLKAQELDPGNAEIQFHLGTVMLGLGDVAGAVSTLEKYVAAAPAETPNVAVAKSIIAAMQKTK
jgi:Flp pilus assembly protein TadD